MKKKGQVAEADVASGIDIEVLMASFVEDNTSQGKNWIFDSGNIVHVCFQKKMFNFLVAKEERDCQDGRWLCLRGHRHWDSEGYRKRWDGGCSEGGPICPGRTVQSNIHRGARPKGYQIQVQQGVVTVSQEDKVILKGEEC